MIIALTEWGDRWAAPQCPPVIYQYDGCGGPARLQLRCDDCDAELAPIQVIARPGPGALPGQF